MTRMIDPGNEKGIVFDIQRFSVHDGPGIRTTVFLKGCPLRCPWCHNPESQRSKPELSFERDLCIACGNCVETCENDAQSIVDGQRSIDRALCEGCGKCVESCYTNALVQKGTTMTVERVLDEVLKDEMLYAKSGGGITLSGGEPTMQPTFALAILEGAQKHGLHTAIETCGFVRWDVLAGILQATDLVIYDIKHLDTVQHKKLVGAGNELILKNLEAIAKQNKDILVRIPLIPGLNDSEENLRASAGLIRKLAIEEVEIIPYHEFAAAKYALLDSRYGLGELQPYAPDQLDSKRRVLARSGANVKLAI